MLDVPVWFSISGLSFPSLHLQSCLEWCPTWCRATVLVSIYYCGFCGSSVNPAISVAVCRPCQGFVLGPTFSSLISSWIKAVTPASPWPSSCWSLCVLPAAGLLAANHQCHTSAADVILLWPLNWIFRTILKVFSCGGLPSDPFVLWRRLEHLSRLRNIKHELVKSNEGRVSHLLDFLLCHKSQTTFPSAKHHHPSLLTHFSSLPLYPPALVSKSLGCRW